MLKINGDAVANNGLYLASSPIRPVGMMDKITNTKFIYHHIMPFKLVCIRDAFQTLNIRIQIIAGTGKARNMVRCE